MFKIILGVGIYFIATLLMSYCVSRFVLEVPLVLVVTG